MFIFRLFYVYFPSFLCLFSVFFMFIFRFFYVYFPFFLCLSELSLFSLCVNPISYSLIDILFAVPNFATQQIKLVSHRP